MPEIADSTLDHQDKQPEFPKLPEKWVSSQPSLLTALDEAAQSASSDSTRAVSGPTIFYTTAGSSYTQNFSTLPDAGGTATITTGTGSPVQGPYDLSSSTGGAFGASGLTGWYFSRLLSHQAVKCV